MVKVIFSKTLYDKFEKKNKVKWWRKINENVEVEFIVALKNNKIWLSETIYEDGIGQRTNEDVVSDYKWNLFFHRPRVIGIVKDEEN